MATKLTPDSAHNEDMKTLAALMLQQANERGLGEEFAAQVVQMNKSLAIPLPVPTRKGKTQIQLNFVIDTPQDGVNYGSRRQGYDALLPHFTSFEEAVKFLTEQGAKLNSFGSYDWSTMNEAWSFPAEAEVKPVDEFADNNEEEEVF